MRSPGSARMRLRPAPRQTTVSPRCPSRATTRSFPRPVWTVALPNRSTIWSLPGPPAAVSGPGGRRCCRRRAHRRSGRSRGRPGEGRRCRRGRTGGRPRERRRGGRDGDRQTGARLAAFLPSSLWARQPLRLSAEPARLGGRGRSPPAQVEVRALVQQHVAEHNPDPHLSIVVRREQRRVDPRLIDVPEPVEESSTGWKAPDLAAAARTWEVVVAGEALPLGLRRGELSS
jgi:hypothetical protein